MPASQRLTFALSLWTAPYANPDTTPVWPIMADVSTEAHDAAMPSKESVQRKSSVAKVHPQALPPHRKLGGLCTVGGALGTALGQSIGASPLSPTRGCRGPGTPGAACRQVAGIITIQSVSSYLSPMSVCLSVSTYLSIIYLSISPSLSVSVLLFWDFLRVTCHSLGLMSLSLLADFQTNLK